MYVCGITFLLFQYTIASSSTDDKLDRGSSYSLRKMEMGINFVPTMPILTRVEPLLYKKGDVNDETLSIKKYVLGEELAKVTWSLI